MLYRVIRDLGNSDYVVGSTFDGDALDPRRLKVLVEQRKIEMVVDPNDPNPGAAVMQAQIAALEARMQAMQAEITTMVDANVALTIQLETVLDQLEADASDAPPDDAPPDDAPPDDAPDLSKLKVEELKALAVERGIEGASSMKRDDLIAALTAGEGASDA